MKKDTSHKDANYMLLVHQAREYKIVFSNNLIQEGILPELTVFEYRVFLYIVSRIKPLTPGMPITDSVLENSLEIIFLCDVLGIAADGHNYQLIKKAVKSLRDKSRWVPRNNEETTVSILSKCTISKGSGTIRYRIDEDIVPYLYGLCENTTRASLVNLLRMSRASSYTLYLLCRSYVGMRIYTVSYAQLRRLLHVADTAYTKFSQFERCVLSVAIDDINKYSDITVQYTTSRIGRSTSSINFVLHTKKQLDTYKVYCDTSEYLDNRIKK